MKYRLVIFDFDGTLADSLPWATNIINNLAEKFQFRPVHNSEHTLLRNYDAAKLFKHLGLPLWKIPLIGNHVRKLMAENIAEVPLFDGVAALLRNLSQQKVYLAIVSSNSIENVQRILGAELATLIDHFECGVTLFGKGQKLRKVLHKSRIHPDDAIYIGDEIRDIDAANHVGISSGAVSWGYNSVESLITHHPTRLFHSIAEITDTILD